MSKQIISKQDAKTLQAASEILARLSQEHDARLASWRKSTTAPTYQEWWNAKRKFSYFVKACGKHNVGMQCSGRMVLVG